MKHLYRFNEAMSPGMKKLADKVKYLMTDITDNHDVEIIYYDDDVSGAELLEVYLQLKTHVGTYRSPNAVGVSSDKGLFSELNERLDDYYNIIKKCQRIILKLEAEGYKSSYLKIEQGNTQIKMTIWEHETP
jgi:hypothetical protein